MTITHQNGRSDEAIILSRTDTQLRVILRNSDDVLELRLLSGTWVTEDCEPVTVKFAPPCTVGGGLPEDYFICSAELASHLVHLLLTDSEEDLPETPVAVPSAVPAGKFVAAHLA